MLAYFSRLSLYQLLAKKFWGTVDVSAHLGHCRKVSGIHTIYDPSLEVWTACRHQLPICHALDVFLFTSSNIPCITSNLSGQEAKWRALLGRA